MLDMDIVNAAMVRQRSESELATANAANAANKKKTELNQEDFLTLMISQLKNQDPFKPLDPSQYVGQLAQFSSVSGLADMNKNITALSDSLRGNQVLDGASLIGHVVVAKGDSVYLPGAQDGVARGVQGLIDVPAGASSVQLVIKDSTGALVRTQALDAHRGTQGFSWDGTDNSGAATAAGPYKVEVVAKVGDRNVSLATSVATRVSSVALDPATGGLVLDTDTLGELAMSDVERVL
ncbi:MAG TPA: flagellar hook capping FlgD N-terminal domain-containing protein [Steroidobacteraceae bacterium]|jgi:flagellar basal-body rod modification protein FlgD|nr:flagellar hook capping FlgD N-terminal domain-containing protein [Steroidobacteraceae bacterium]